MAVRRLHWTNPTRSTGRSWSFSTKSPYPSDRAAGTLSALQIIQLLERQKQEGHRSLGSRILHGGASAIGHPIMKALDIINRPYQGTLSFLHGGGENANPWDFDYGQAAHGFREGLMGREKLSIQELMNERDTRPANWLQKHKKTQAAVGFGLGIAIDPTTYVTGGTAGIASKAGGKAALKATKALDMSIEDGLTKAQYGQKLKEFKPHVEVLKNQAKTDPARFTHRAKAADMFQKQLHKMSFGAKQTVADEDLLRSARAAAFAEARQHTPRGLTIKAFGKQSAPLPIPLPARGALGKAGVPVVSKVAANLGEKFKPGYSDPVGHAIALSRRHAQEQYSQRYLDHIRKLFKGHKAIKKDRQIEALHYFEKKGGVVKAEDGSFILNPKRVAEALKHGLTEDEIDFVQRMHHAGEYLAKQDKEFGLKYEKLGEQGKLYVPHIVKKDHDFLMHDLGTDLLSVRGYLKKRKDQNLSIKDIQHLKSIGQLPRGLEDDPFKLLVMRARAAANQHADTGMLRYVTDAHGIPKRLVDTIALSKAEARIAEIEAQIKGHPMSNGMPAQAAKTKDAVVRALKTSADLKHQERIANNTRRIKELLEGDQGQTTLATVARMSRRAKKWAEEHEATLKAIDAGKHRGMTSRLREADEPFRAARKEYRELDRELARMKAAAKALRKGTKNPDYNPAEHLTIQGRSTQKHLLKTPEGHDIAYPAEVANAMTKLNKVVQGDEETIKAFEQSYRKYISKWKLAVTAVNPGYGVRNTLSDFWNMWLSDVPLAAIPVYGAKAAALMRAFGKGDPRAVREIRDAYGQGVLSGLFQGDVQLASDVMRSGLKTGDYAKRGRLIKAYSQGMQDLNRNRENWGRLTHYLYRRDKGMGPAEAAFEVKKAHFDYEDLTEFEQRKMKTIAPFYTWTRKNLPYQLEKLVMAPGRMAAFPKLQANMSAAAGDEGNVPGYVENQLMLPLGKGNYLSPMIGITDLMKLENPKDSAMGMVNPAFKVPFELATNTNTFTDQPIKDPSGHSRNPIRDGIVSEVLRNIPGSDVGQTKRGGVAGSGASPYLTYFAGMTPFTNYLVNRGGKINDSKSVSHRGELSFLAGLGVTKVDPERQATIDELAFQERMKGIMRTLRDEGLVPEPKKRKKSANQRMLERALQKSLGGG